MDDSDRIHIYDIAEMIVCAGIDIARRAHEIGQGDGQASEAALGAVDLLLLAVEQPDTAEMRHTADVAEMIFGGHAASAFSMHVAHVTAEHEREDLGASEANELDLYLAGALLEANSWRLSVGLALA